jgi:hypothetical protein
VILIFSQLKADNFLWLGGRVLNKMDAHLIFLPKPLGCRRVAFSFVALFEMDA